MYPDTGILANVSATCNYDCKAQLEEAGFINPCPHCDDINLRAGAGLKPNQFSLHCLDCRRFIGYQEVTLTWQKINRLSMATLLAEQGGMA